jgi:hypothetical protein
MTSRDFSYVVVGLLIYAFLASLALSFFAR